MVPLLFVADQKSTAQSNHFIADRVSLFLLSIKADIAWEINKN